MDVQQRQRQQQQQQLSLTRPQPTHSAPALVSPRRPTNPRGLVRDELVLVWAGQTQGKREGGACSSRLVGVGADEGWQVTVELKNDLAITGTLHSVDQDLNIKLTHIKVSSEQKFRRRDPDLHLLLGGRAQEGRVRGWVRGGPRPAHPLHTPARPPTTKLQASGRPRLLLRAPACGGRGRRRARSWRYGGDPDPAEGGGGGGGGGPGGGRAAGLGGAGQRGGGAGGVGGVCGGVGGAAAAALGPREPGLVTDGDWNFRLRRSETGCRSASRRHAEVLGPVPGRDGGADDALGDLELAAEGVDVADAIR